MSTETIFYFAWKFTLSLAEYALLGFFFIVGTYFVVMFLGVLCVGVWRAIKRHLRRI